MPRDYVQRQIVHGLKAPLTVGANGYGLGAGRWGRSLFFFAIQFSFPGIVFSNILNTKISIEHNPN